MRLRLPSTLHTHAHTTHLVAHDERLAAFDACHTAFLWKLVLWCGGPLTANTVVHGPGCDRGACAVRQVVVACMQVGCLCLAATDRRTKTRRFARDEQCYARATPPSAKRLLHVEVPWPHPSTRPAPGDTLALAQMLTLAEVLTQPQRLVVDLAVAVAVGVTQRLMLILIHTVALTPVQGLVLVPIHTLALIQTLIQTLGQTLILTLILVLRRSVAQNPVQNQPKVEQLLHMRLQRDTAQPQPRAAAPSPTTPGPCA